MSLAPYRLTLPPTSGVWVYTPSRDDLAREGWNATYSGSSVWPPGGGSENGSGSNYYRTQNGDAKVRIDFTGTGLLLCLKANGVATTLTVDGQTATPPAVSNDQSCLEFGATTTISVTGLDFGSHQVALAAEASGDNEFQFFGGVAMTNIAVDSGETSAAEVVVDDRSDTWALTRGGGDHWDVAEKPTAINGTLSFICPYGEGLDASYTFKGASAVVLYGAPGRDNHGYGVSLGSTLFESDSSVSGWNSPSTPLFFQAGLDPTVQYTLGYSNYNSNDKDCLRNHTRYCCLTLDGIRLIGPTTGLAHLLPVTTSTPTQTFSGSTTKSQASAESQAPPPVGGSSTNAGPIAGGVVGGIALALAVGGLLFVLGRRRRREAENRPALPYGAGSSGSGGGGPMRQRVDFTGETTYSGVGVSSSGGGAVVGSGSVVSSDPSIRPFVGGLVGSPVVAATTSPQSGRTFPPHSVNSADTYSPHSASAGLSPVTLLSGGPVLSGKGGSPALGPQYSNSVAAQSGSALSSYPTASQVSRSDSSSTRPLAANPNRMSYSLPPAYTAD